MTDRGTSTHAVSGSASDSVSAAQEFTGERFLPTLSGEIAYEHWHRYAFARRFVEGKRVLDAACGEGYGTALLGAAAASVTGVDIDVASIDRARAAYGEGERVRFVASSCTGLPLPGGSIDVVVSFETIEHVAAADQLAMLLEFARVLTPDGLLVISSPNKRLYSDERQYVNQFHLQELYRNELAQLLAKRFPAQRWHHQRLGYWSGIWIEREASPRIAGTVEAWVGDGQRVAPYPTPEGMYFVVVAARDPKALPADSTALSLFTDADDSEVKRAEANAREVLRLDGLLGRNDEAFARHGEHIRHLETLVVERERVIAERDAALRARSEHVQHLETLVAERDRAIADAESAHSGDRGRIASLEEQIASLDLERSRLEAERSRLEAALSAQQRAIAYLGSMRGWIGWPLRRLRRWRESAR
ncbi:MAG TPA: methyltransferase domain-containing protein [Casimicrobiaceae bacterium]|nr:methyltransferase domain-containing protein [Casimicrobiaceae bacterium]